MRTAMLTAMALPLLIVSCLYCAAPVDQSHYLDRMGGDTWRVFDADEIDMLEVRGALREMHAEAADCVGETKPLRSVRVFATSAIFRKHDNGTWKPAYGLYVKNKIYIVRGLTELEARQVLTHEMAHYVSDLGHPEIDGLLKSCGIIVTLERENG